MAEGGDLANISKWSILRQIDARSEDTLCVTSLADGRLISCHESAFKVWRADGSSLLHTIAAPTAGDVTCVCQSPADQHQLAVSVSSTVACYDDRNLSAPVHSYQCNSEEVNEVYFHHRGPYLCACDDSGEVKIIDTENRKLFKTLSGRHSNLCASAKFLPRKPWEVVSGGMDCKVIRWDFSRPRPIAEVSTQQTSGETRSEDMLVNPPMVHSLDTWPSNHCVACGLGNGDVVVYEMRGKEIAVKCLLSLHSAMVARVCCIERVERGEKSYYVVSGANDCKLVLSKMVEREKGTERDASVHKRGSRSVTHLQPVSEVQHGSKVNWLCVNSAATEVYVADQTSIVTVYELLF